MGNVYQWTWAELTLDRLAETLSRSHNLIWQVQYEADLFKA